MTVELWVLVASAMLHWLLVLTSACGATWYRGVQWTVGNRAETGPELPPWLGRVQKASHNLQENLMPFAILVLVVWGTGHRSDITALGAEMFLGARLAHALCYAMGIKWARSAAYVVSMVGAGMVASALLSNVG